MRHRSPAAALVLCLCVFGSLGISPGAARHALASSSAAPAAAPSPVVPPRLSVVGVRILHLVRGKEVATQHLRTGEYAEFLVQYAAAGATHVSVILDITKNGKKLGSVLLQPVTYAGHPAFGWIFGFTRDAGFGTFYAHFHLSASGGLTVKRDRKFFVTLH